MTRSKKSRKPKDRKKRKGYIPEEHIMQEESKDITNSKVEDNLELDFKERLKDEL